MRSSLYKRITLSCLLSVCLLLCACQATPEEDFVIGQIDESIYDNNGAEMIPVKEAEGYGSWNWKEFSYQDSFQGADGKAHINVDISGEYLEDPVPVLRVSHHTLTVDDLKEAAGVLMPAETYYDPTKLIDSEILRSWIKSGVNTGTYEKLLEEQDGSIDRFETDWLTHSGSENYYSLEYGPDKDQSGISKTLFIRTASNEKGDFGFMQFLDVTGESFRSNELEYCKANGYSNRGFCFGVRDKNKDPKNTITRSEAEKQIKEQLKDLGLQMHASASFGGESGMTIWCYPSYFGIDYLCSQTWSEYAVEHRPECLYVNIRGDEIYHLKQICVTDVVIENDKLPLITKDEVLTLFKKYMQTVYTGAHAASAGDEVIPEEMLDEAKEVRIEVGRMQFGYARIPIKDEPTEFRLVPSWVFYGQSYLVYENGEEMPVFSEEANPGIAEGQILMVVNAIDGSYIQAQRESYE